MLWSVEAQFRVEFLLDLSLKMLFALQFISLLLIFPQTRGHSEGEEQEDDSLAQSFKDLSVEIIAPVSLKREAAEFSDDVKTIASIFSPNDLIKSHHYWTRKRGRDHTSTPDPPQYYYYQNYYQNRGVTESDGKDLTFRRKREILKKKLHSRPKRQVEGDIATDEPAPKNSPKDLLQAASKTSDLDQSRDSYDQSPSNAHDRKNQRNNFGKRFGNKL